MVNQEVLEEPAIYDEEVRTPQKQRTLCCKYMNYIYVLYTYMYYILTPIQPYHSPYYCAVYMQYPPHCPTFTTYFTTSIL